MLILDLPAEQRVRIGRLGNFPFPVGTYLYFGSAFGPGGLQARISHHLKVSNRPFWHLDYLRPFARIKACFFSLSDRPLECEWQRIVAQIFKPLYPAMKLGASDCREGCSAHLLRSGCQATIPDLRMALEEVNVDVNFLPLDSQRPTQGIKSMV